MNKISRIGLVFGTLLMLLALMIPSNVSAWVQDTDMIAGQDWDNPVGKVLAYAKGDNLVVIYKIDDELKDDCEITETHLWVGDSWATLPTTKKGNIKVGHLPYNEKSEECLINRQYMVRYEIPFADIPDEDKDGNPRGEMLYIVAHAVVKCGDQEETSWADTDPELHTVPGVSGWALYFPFEIGL